MRTDIAKLAIPALALTLAIAAPSASAQPRPAAPAARPTLTPPRVQTLRAVEIQEVTGTLDMTRAKPTVQLSQKIRNAGRKPLDIEIGPRDLAAQRVRLAAGGQQVLRWSLPVQTERVGNKVKSLTISPHILIDRASAPIPVARYSIAIRLPRGAKKIVKSNKPLVPERRGDGTTQYRWSGTNEYLTTLHVLWTSSATDLEMQKTIAVDRATRIATVTITVVNNGRAGARGVVLSENFVSQDYQGVQAGSMGKFTSYAGQTNDRRLLWEYTLPALRPGAQTTVTYKLAAHRGVPDVRLYETTALESGEPIAVTNTAVAPL